MTRTLVVSASMIALIALSAFLFLHRDSPAIAYDALPLEGRYEYWLDRISSGGGKAAYEEFVTAVEPYPTALRHLNAHYFGKALFDAEGPAGIVACDGRFIYGCFHAFTIRAVEVGGQSAAQDMFDRCAEALGETAEQCQHGIGHGLLGSIGYGLEDLSEALRVCETLGTSTNPVGGCPGGVMMEYGSRGMQGLGFDTYREFSEDMRLEPCVSLTGRHRMLCAYWQPMWWTEAVPFRDDPARLAREMGRWCEELAAEDREVLRNCIAGVGNRIQVLTREDPSETAAACARVTEDSEMLYLCHKTSAVRFTTYYPLEFSLTACAGLSDGAEARCRLDATAASAARRANRPD